MAEDCLPEAEAGPRDLAPLARADAILRGEDSMLC